MFMRRILMIVAMLGIAVSAGAQAPTSKPNRLGIQGYAGWERASQGSVIHLTGKAIVWFESGSQIIADEATINFDTNQIEFKGNVLMRPR